MAISSAHGARLQELTSGLKEVQMIWKAARGGRRGALNKTKGNQKGHQMVMGREAACLTHFLLVNLDISDFHRA